MATAKQIAANRRNAQHSTGPKTDAGKQRAAMNAVRHGLYSDQVVLYYEHVEHYHELLDSLLDDWKPQTARERLLIEQIAQAAWRMQRATRIESGTFNLLLRDLTHKVGKEHPPHGDEGMAIVFMEDKFGLDRLRRYFTAAERTYERLIEELLYLRSQHAKLAPFRTGDVETTGYREPWPFRSSPDLHRSAAAPGPRPPVATRPERMSPEGDPEAATDCDSEAPSGESSPHTGLTHAAPSDSSASGADQRQPEHLGGRRAWATSAAPRRS